MALLSQALHLGYLLSPHSAFQGHAAHTARWPAMLSPNGSAATCIADGVFHIPMPCFHGALPGYPKVVPHASIPLSRRTARHEQRLLGVGFRVEPVVTPPAPPQTRTGAMHAYGASVTSASAPLWRLTVRPCMARQMGGTIRGIGRIGACRSFAHFAHPMAFLPLRRLRPYRHAVSAPRRPSSNRRKVPRTPSYGQGPRRCEQRLWYGY